MEALATDRKIVLNRIRYAYKLFVAMDLEGTLIPPGDGALTKLKAKERDLLAQLVRLNATHLAIVTERPIEAVNKAVHVPGMFYSGSSGLEYAAPGEPLVQLAVEEKLEPFEAFAKELKKLAGHTRGVSIERSPLQIKVDWSKAAAAPRKSFGDAIKELETSHATAIRAFPGRQSADYLPQTGYDKGTGTLSFLRKVGFNLKSDLALYIGDDTPDEDAFRGIGNLGLTFRVGRATTQSAAKYSLKNPAEVWSLLQSILEVRGPQVANMVGSAARMF